MATTATTEEIRNENVEPPRVLMHTHIHMFMCAECSVELSLHVAIVIVVVVVHMRDERTCVRFVYDVIQKKMHDFAFDARSHSFIRSFGSFSSMLPHQSDDVCASALLRC